MCKQEQDTYGILLLFCLMRKFCQNNMQGVAISRVSDDSLTRIAGMVANKARPVILLVKGHDSVILCGCGQNFCIHRDCPNIGAASLAVGGVGRSVKRVEIWLGKN